jgi:hypothetical protein
MEPMPKNTVIQSPRTEAVEDFLKTVSTLQKQHDPVPTAHCWRLSFTSSPLRD